MGPDHVASRASVRWSWPIERFGAIDAAADATRRKTRRCGLDHAIMVPSLSSTTSPRWMPTRHLDCAANGIDDASELYEDAVTRPLDDAAVMHGDGGIDQIASQRSEAGKCPLLVGPGKLAESDHIRRKKAASFRVSAMAVPSPHARLARLLIGLYRLWVQHLIQHLLGVASSRLPSGLKPQPVSHQSWSIPLDTECRPRPTASEMTASVRFTHRASCCPPHARWHGK